MERYGRVTVGHDGHVTLPAAALAQLGIGPGDRLDVAVDEGGLRLTLLPRDVVEVTYGLASELYRGLGGSAEFLREMEESWRV